MKLTFKLLARNSNFELSHVVAEGTIFDHSYLSSIATKFNFLFLVSAPNYLKKTMVYTVGVTKFLISHYIQKMTKFDNFF